MFRRLALGNNVQKPPFQNCSNIIQLLSILLSMMQVISSVITYYAYCNSIYFGSATLIFDL